MTDEIQHDENVGDATPSYVHPSAQELRSCGWERYLSATETRGYGSISTVLRSATNEAMSVGQDGVARGLMLLDQIFSMVLQPDDPASPFGPRFQFNNGRSLIPSDISEDLLPEIETIAKECSNPWVHSRLFDTLWTRRRHSDDAIRALNAYANLKTSPEEWNREVLSAWRRAFTLARTLGRRNRHLYKMIADSFLTVTEHILSLRADYALSVLELLLDRGMLKGSSPDDLAMIDRLLERVAQSEHWFLQRQVLELKRRVFSSSRMDQKRYTTTLAIAQLLWDESTKEVEVNHLHVSNLLIAVISEIKSVPKAIRQESGAEVILQQARTRLRESQGAAAGSMARIESDPIDISAGVDEVEERLTGLDRTVALIRYTRMVAQIDLVSLRSHSEELTREFQLLTLLGGSLVDKNGRVVGHRTKLDLHDPSSMEAVIAERMVETFLHRRAFDVSIVVQTGLGVLNSEHTFERSYLNSLCSQSLVVPSERVEIWARGIQLGFSGLWFEAAHVLIPQLEYWVRWLLDALDVQIIQEAEDGTQKYIPMEMALSNPMLADVLDESLLFELKALFMSNVGPDARNTLSHGLIDDNETEAFHYPYTWYLSLRIAVSGLQAFHTFNNRKRSQPRGE